MVELKDCTFYWFRHKVEKVWRVCYVAVDPDENQWLEIIGVDKASEVKRMDLAWFDWIELAPPEVIGE